MGETRLAKRVEHVSKTLGDGLGFDVRSFDANGRERLIEVKTKAFGRETPFFVSRNELTVSEARSQNYHLYRLFDFRAAPRIFTLYGALSTTCRSGDGETSLAPRPRRYPQG